MRKLYRHVLKLIALWQIIAARYTFFFSDWLLKGGVARLAKHNPETLVKLAMAIGLVEVRAHADIADSVLQQMTSHPGAPSA